MISFADRNASLFHRHEEDPALPHRHHSEPHHHHSEPPAKALARGAGRGRVLYLDAHSGLAGDMIIAALLDLGVPFSVVENATAALSLSDVRVRTKRVQRGAIAATQFDVELLPHDGERSYKDVVALIAASSLSASVQEHANLVFRRLADAESRVHGTSIEHVHFHEVGAADAIVDIVGAAACLDYLGAELVCSPLPLGRGHVRCRHGVIPLPAPATVLCLEGMETLDSGLNAELVTPTGAAIVGALAVACRYWPPMRPLAVGWGAGHQLLPDRPNALRAVLGIPAEVASTWATHEVIECNVDDMTGEQIAHTIRMLMEHGALDAWAQPIIMKKGRAAWTLSALSSLPQRAVVERVMLRESSSIGLRRYAVTRHEMPREVIEVQTSFGLVPVKVSGIAEEGTRHVKPEFDACVTLAEQHGVPVREVLLAAQAAAFARGI